MKYITFALAKYFNFWKIRGFFILIYFTLHTCHEDQNCSEFHKDHYSTNSNSNQNRGPNLIFSPPNFTKSEITFFSFCVGFQALSIFFIWLKSRRNPLIVSMNNSKNWVFASGQVWGPGSRCGLVWSGHKVYNNFPF